MEHECTVTRINLNTSGKGSAVAFFSARVNGMNMRDMTLIPSTRGTDSHFVGFPSAAPFKGTKGDTVYPDYFYPDSSELRDTITKAAISALEAHEAAEKVKAKTDKVKK